MCMRSVYTTSNQEKGMLLREHRDAHGSCIVMFLESIGDKG